MELLFIYFVSIGASIYLFPFEWDIFIKRLQASLDRLRQQREQTAIRQAWISLSVITHQSLKHKDPIHLQIQTLTKALAAGERYLKLAVPTDAPRMYQLTEEICDGIRDKLNELRRAQKNRARSS